MTKLFVNSAFFDEIKKALLSAENEICIIIYNWHFYDLDPSCLTSQLNNIIFDKLKKGVKVKVVVGNQKLFNYLKSKGVNVKNNKMRGLNHAKVVIIDNKFCSVGSHNFSENAWSRNEEASIVSNELDLINQCKKYFNILHGSL